MLKQVLRCPPLLYGAMLSGLAMSTFATWSGVVQPRDVSPHNFDGLAMSGLKFSHPHISCIVNTICLKLPWLKLLTWLKKKPRFSMVLTSGFRFRFSNRHNTSNIYTFLLLRFCKNRFYHPVWSLDSVFSNNKTNYADNEGKCLKAHKVEWNSCSSANNGIMQQHNQIHNSAQKFRSCCWTACNTKHDGWLNTPQKPTFENLNS